MHAGSNVPPVSGGDDASFIAQLGAGADHLCEQFNLGSSATARVHTVLPFTAARRFEIPFADGAGLSLGRPNGPAFRAEISKAFASRRVLQKLEGSTFDHATMLEFIDRCGSPEGQIAFAASADDNEFVNVGQFPERTEAVNSKHIMPLVRQTLLALFHDLTGVVPSKDRDFRKVKGKRVAVPGSPADFLERALTIGGWTFTAAQLAKGYMLVRKDGSVAL